MSVQTGTSHGGVVLPDGTIAKVALDFSVLDVLGRAGRQRSPFQAFPSLVFCCWLATDPPSIRSLTLAGTSLSRLVCCARCDSVLISSGPRARAARPARSCGCWAAGKPSPLMLHELMREFGVEAERTLMIGDTTHDLQMALNAGCASVGVSYGAHEPAAFDVLRPRAVAHSDRR